VYDASGVLIAEYSGEVAAEPRVSYLTTDHLGSPRVTTNERGVVVNRRDFMPFGEEINGVGGRTTGLNYGSDSVRQKFTGYERDIESDLDFAQARYYNSSHGRFTSVDPLTASATIRNPQTFNRYSYGLNSPYKFTDPLGLSIDLVGCNFECRVMNAINGIGKLSAADLALAKYHVANGTALGYVFLNASYNQLRPQTAGVGSPNPQGPNDNMKMGEEGRKLLIQWEGYRDVPYDKDNSSGSRNCTIGIGHLLHPGPCRGSSEDQRKYSAGEIDAFFKADVASAESHVRAGITKVKLDQNQFDALVVLALNFRSTPKLYAAINANKLERVKAEWLSTNKVKDEHGNLVFSQGLQNRRDAEWALYNKPVPRFKFFW